MNRIIFAAKEDDLFSCKKGSTNRNDLSTSFSLVERMCLLVDPFFALTDVAYICGQ